MNSKERCQRLVKEFQNTASKAVEATLLEELYLPACNYAFGYLKANSYSNLLSYEDSEVQSYVYIAFRKALKNYDSHGSNVLSFKNYFYQMIKYETFSEMKKNFNWQVIPNFSKHCKIITQSLNQNLNIENQTLDQLDAQLKMQKIHQFLKTKKGSYASIWQLKCKGYDNRDICKKLKLSSEQVKGKIQYIKKLVLQQYGTLDNVA